MIMDVTIEKIENINISNKETETTKEAEKSTSKKDQYCLKMLDYFVF